MGQPWRSSLRGSKAVSVAVVFLLALSASAVEEKEAVDDADIAGPVVKATASASAEGKPASPPSGAAPPPPPTVLLIANGTLAGVNGTNVTVPGEPKKTVAQVLDEALEREFPQEVQKEGVGKVYNETSHSSEATIETVIKVSATKQQAKVVDKNADPANKSVDVMEEYGTSNTGTKRNAQPKDQVVEKEVDRIIDAQDNEYILSKPKDGTVGLTLDPQLIRDLTVLISSSAAAGLVLEALRQPVINGFFIAGSLVGPGGLQLVKELVQVESLAQVGVQLLLFTLGLEFSISKLRAVRSVALIGGLVQIFLFMILAGLVASFIGAPVHEGIFVGALVSMSSTSIVIKCLEDAKTQNSAHGQITIGTLILQDCMVGLLFAFMPVLGSTSEGAVSNADIAAVVVRVSLTLGSMLLVAAAVARTVLPPLIRQLARHTSSEMFMLSTIALCLCSSWLTGKLQLSTELGAFVAGVMLSATEQQEQMLELLEPIKHLFIALFVSSTGLIMSPRFLLQHFPVLIVGVAVVILGKTALISGVVWLFRYPWRTALAVGLGMAQIGEFAFVLLSVAAHFGLMRHQEYMLLMGVTALSLLLTPFMLQLAQRLHPFHPLPIHTSPLAAEYSKDKRQGDLLEGPWYSDGAQDVELPYRGQFDRDGQSVRHKEKSATLPHLGPDGTLLPRRETCF